MLRNVRSNNCSDSPSGLLRSTIAGAVFVLLASSCSAGRSAAQPAESDARPQLTAAIEGATGEEGSVFTVIVRNDSDVAAQGCVAKATNVSSAVPASNDAAEPTPDAERPDAPYPPIFGALTTATAEVEPAWSLEPNEAQEIDVLVTSWAFDDINAWLEETAQQHREAVPELRSYSIANPSIVDVEIVCDGSDHAAVTKQQSIDTTGLCVVALSCGA